MTLKYTSSKSDYLEYYLYSASLDKVGKQIWRNTLASTTGFLLFAFVLYWEGSYLMAGTSVLVSVLMLLISPGYSKDKLRESYERIINKQFEYENEQSVAITFGESSIEYSSFMGRNEIYHVALKSIEDVSKHFFIFLKSGHSIIISKAEIDVDATRAYLQSLAQKLSIPFNSNLNWKWK